MFVCLPVSSALVWQVLSHFSVAAQHLVETSVTQLSFHAQGQAKMLQQFFWFVEAKWLNLEEMYSQ
jgi:hypothetical protein